MSREREIQFLEERLDELRRQAALEKRAAVGALRPSAAKEEEPTVEPERPATPARSPRTPRKARKAPSRADIQRMERAVVGLVVVFFGSCVALASVDHGEAKKEAAPAADEPAPRGEAPGRAAARPDPRAEAVPTGPNPMAVCERLVDVGAAGGCEAKESLQEGVRIAEFTLAHGGGDKGAVRTFDSVARCQDSSAGLLSGGVRFDRCDVRTTVHLAAGTPAEDVSAARRVVTSL